jgi:hypothetical protein
MIKLKEIEQVMKPNFIWNRSGLKPLQVNEEYEGNKELARTIFVGIADMYGFKSDDICDYLDCGYDSYRHKLSQFREYYQIGYRHREKLHTCDESVKKFYIKVGLCLNSIKLTTKRNPYIKLEEYI